MYFDMFVVSVLLSTVANHKGPATEVMTEGCPALIQTKSVGQKRNNF